MPNNGNAYPGVDPLPPNGLIAAGKILAENIGPLVYARLSATVPQSIAAGVQSPLVFDTVSHLGVGFTLSNDGIHLTYTGGGMLFAIGDAYLDSGPAGAGVMRCQVQSGSGIDFGGSATLDELAQGGEANAFSFVDSASAINIDVLITNNSNATEAYDGDLLVVRLGSET